MNLERSKSLSKQAFGLLLCVLSSPGCVMEPSYLGYEVDLEAQDSIGQETSGVQESTGGQEEQLPEEPEFELTKRECRRLGRRLYSECRHACEDDDRRCKERCEREARDFMRECLAAAKKGPKPNGPEEFPEASAFDKSNDFLKETSDSAASSKF